ncbi:MAG: TonB-dependent receptor plug domain-containing protein [Bacteroidetes bacterium]|nr:TonB-dependent receptor plug domain-containing protein [Bacteroidota bacterium]
MIHGTSGADGAARLLGRAVLVVCCALAFAAPHLHAQEHVPSDSARAAAHVDSAVAAQRDTVRADSAHRPVLSRHFSREHGEPLGALTEATVTSGSDIVTKRDLIWDRYTTAFEPLAGRLPAYPMSMGAPGLVRSLSYAGSSPRSIGISYNGRPMASYDGSAYDLETYPLEFIERVELLRGAKAAIFGNGESLIAVNMVEPRYDVAGSYMRLWYSQEPNGTNNADVTYARNVGANAGLALGLRYLTTDGVYPGGNQVGSGWSVRGALRWQASTNFTVSLTELYTDLSRGLNGGLSDTTGSVPLLATVVNTLLEERIVRHDLTLAARWYPLSHGVADTAAPGKVISIPDTTIRVDAALYATFGRHAIDSSGGPELAPNSTSGSNVGLRLGLEMPLGPLRLLGNGIFAESSINGFQSEFGGLVEIPLGGSLMLRGGMKLSTVGTLAFQHLVGEGVFALGDSFSLRLTARYTVKLSGSGCPGGAVAGDSIRTLDDHYTRALGEAEIEWRGGIAHAGIDLFARQAQPYDCVPLPAYTVTGAGVSVAFPIALLVLDNHLVATMEPSAYRAFPLLHGTSDLYAPLLLVDGNLDLRVGTTLEYLSSPGLVAYDGYSGEFYSLASNTYAGKRPPFPNWSIYAQARIGTAYIRAEMRNLLSSEFATMYRYPTFRRGIYLGVNWAFVD